MKRLLAFLAVALAGCPSVDAGINGVSLGTGARPTTLGGYTMTPFPCGDGFTGFAPVTAVPAPYGGSIAFSPTVFAADVGSSWATWSGTYACDVYYVAGTSVTLTMPANTGAFYFYAEPNPFAVYTITATGTTGGKSATIVANADGSAGAAGFGFYGTCCTSKITSITVSCSVDFAVGEFAIALNGGVTMQALGTGVPPPTIGGHPMTPFACGDPYTGYAQVTSPIPSPRGGSVSFSSPMYGSEVGTGPDACWSHPYACDTYWTGGAWVVTLILPPNTGAFYLYAVPNAAGVYTIKAEGYDGVTRTALWQDVDGPCGAKGFAFYAHGCSRLQTITVSCPIDFIIGEFGIASMDIQATALGPVVPPTTIDGWKMKTFQKDPRTLGATVSTIANPLGAPLLGLSPALVLAEVPTTWATWSGSYAGSVYWQTSAAPCTVNLPAGTTAFYLYAEPDPFAVFTIKAEGSDGISGVPIVQSVNGSGGAAGYAFSGGAGITIQSVTVSAAVDFAIGEFGISQGCFCLADCNQDGKLDVNDFLCILTQFQSKTDYADFNDDGKWNVNDWIAYQAAFSGKIGCP